MSRPCVCGRTDVGRPYQPGQCYLCWLAVNTVEYGLAWAVGVPANPQPIPGVTGVVISNLAPCTHLGDELTIKDKQRYGLELHRAYSLCTHPDLPNKRLEFVCPCNGCGPRCDGYTAPNPTQ